MLDGDQMGKWLSGENAPAIKNILHPKLVSYFSGLGAEAEAALAGRRPVGPAMHAAISQALANFAVHVAPSVVRKHKGTLIYSGGDDVLALLPVETAVPCALELYRAFRGEGGEGGNSGYFRINDRDLLMMGSEATLSGGFAVVHYKSDLHRSLEEARGAEKDAKRKGRDALVVKACRRSGEHTSVICPWSFIPRVEGLVEAFTRGASDRFAYHLAAERQTLQGLPPEAQRAELRRQIQRTEPESREKLTGFKDKQRAGAKMVELFGEYSDALGKKGADRHELLSRFIDLLQTASFLARGREY
jgi:CRISPR-associated protein Cmr2